MSEVSISVHRFRLLTIRKRESGQTAAPMMSLTADVLHIALSNEIGLKSNNHLHIMGLHMPCVVCGVTLFPPEEAAAAA